MDFDAILDPIKFAEEAPLRPIKGSKATDMVLLANNGGTGVVLDYHGMGIQSEIEACGVELEYLGFDDVPDGISIWEGKLKVTRDYWGEYDTSFEGQARDLTDQEWDLLKDTGAAWEYDPCVECGWNDDGYGRCTRCAKELEREHEATQKSTPTES